MKFRLVSKKMELEKIIPISKERIKEQIVGSLVLLTIRRILVQLILTGSNIVLARLLSPAIFGAFAIIGFLTTIPGLIVPFGLGQALIQKPEKATKEELRAIFTALTLGSFIIILLIFILAPLSKLIYHHIGTADIFWLRLLSLNLLFINLRTISVSLLEKDLDYRKLAIGEIACLFLSQTLAVVLAFKGFGIGSLVLGNLVANFLSFFLFLLLAPWPIGLVFTFSKITKYFPFAFNYQLSEFILSLKLAIIPGFVGAVAGQEAVGLINWATGVKEVSLAPADIINRLVFPAGAMVARKKKLFKVLIERLAGFSFMFCLPILALILALGQPITKIIYTSKWLPGLTALYISLFGGIFALVGSTMNSTLLALGRAKTVRNINYFWTVSQLLLTLPLVIFWNFNGAVLASTLTTATFFIPLKEVKKIVKIELFHYFQPYLLYSLLTYIFLSVLKTSILIDSLTRLVLIGISGAIFYWGIVVYFQGKQLRKDVKFLLQLIFGKS